MTNSNYTYREEIIRNYIEGYNELDTVKMIRDLKDEIVFQNVQNEVITMTINGIMDFKIQAAKSKSYFMHRHQEITSISHYTDRSAIKINYTSVLAMDFPNGLKKGQEIIQMENLSFLSKAIKLFNSLTNPKRLIFQ